MKNKIVTGILSALLLVSIAGNVYLFSNNNELKVASIDNETEVTNLNTKISETDAKLKEAESKSTELENNISELKSQVEELTKQIEEVKANPFGIVDCEPTTKYTNDEAEIFGRPEENGGLVDTVAINTELTVTGTTEDGSWSRVEHAGMICFIKSSLLSDSKTQVKKSSGSSSSSGGTSSSGSASSGSSSGGSASSGTAGGPPHTGINGTHSSGRYDGGKTGADCSDLNLGGVY